MKTSFLLIVYLVSIRSDDRQTDQYTTCKKCNYEGVCTQSGSKTLCQCLEGYFSPELCVKVIDQCSGNACDSSHTCVSGFGYHYCKCPEGKTGKYCTDPVNENNAPVIEPRLYFPHFVEVNEKFTTYVTASDLGAAEEIKVIFQKPKMYHTIPRSKFTKSDNVKTLIKGFKYAKYVTKSPVWYTMQTYQLNTPGLTNLELEGIVFAIGVSRRGSVLPIPDVELINCASGMDDVPPWEVEKKYFINAKIYKREDTSLETTWTLEQNFPTDKPIMTFEKSKNKNQLIIEPYSVRYLQQMAVKILVKETPNSGQSAENFQLCWIRYQNVPTYAYIEGGDSRRAGKSQELVLDGSKSRDPNQPPEEQNEVSCVWSCTSEPAHDFCKTNIFNEKIFKIPPNILNVGVYKFTLQVNSPKGSKSSLAKQTVNIVEGTPIKVLIKCIKNCEKNDYKPNPQKDVYYLATCQENCQGVTQASYEWEMVPGSGNKKTSLDFTSETVHGKTTDKLIVKKNILTADDTYTFSVTVQSQNSPSGKAEDTLKMNTPPTVDSCSLNPDTGFSFDTTFVINCTGAFDEDVPLRYSIYQEKEGPEGKTSYVLIGYNSEPIREIRLTAGSRLMVKVVDKYDMYTEYELKATVKPLQIKGDDFKEKLNYIDSLFEGKIPGSMAFADAAVSGDITVISGRVNSIIDAVTKLKASNENDNKNLEDKKNYMWRRISKKLGQLTSRPRFVLYLEQVADTLNYMNKLKATMVRHDVAIEIAIAAENVVKRLEDQVKASKSPNLLWTKAKDISRSILETTGNLLDGNLANVSEISTTSTIYPLIVTETVTEDYPNYEDLNEEYITSKYNYKSAVIKVLETQKKISDIMDYTMENGEMPFEKNFTNGYFYATVGNLGELSNKSQNEVSYNGINVKISPDVTKVAVTELSVCVFTKNPFWWQDKSSFNVSSAVSIEMKDHSRHEDIKDLLTPIEITFKIENTNASEWINGTTEAPSDFNQWKYLDDNITTYKIELQLGSRLTIQFDKTENNNELLLVITKRRRATIKDFDDAISIPNNDTGYAVIQNEVSKGEWFYIALLPAIRTDSSSKLLKGDFSLSFTSSLCLTWDERIQDWNSLHCAAHQNGIDGNITCKCSHLSVFGATTVTPHSVLVPLIRIPFELSPSYCYIVFITVGVLYLFYLSGILFTYYRNKRFRKKQKVHFLKDNIYTDEHNYMVSVYTGDVDNAGTTSNIGITIWGTVTNSSPHILTNDKENIFKRRSIDRFILTTPQTLGNVLKIVLWIDGNDRSPSWFCKKIIIADLKSLEEWDFIVENWFTSKTDDMHRIVYPNEKKERKSTTKNFLFTIRKEEIFISAYYNSRENIEYNYLLQYSIELVLLLTQLFLLMVFYGVPRFSNASQLDDGHFVFSFTVVGYGIAAAVMTYLAYRFIIYLFRRFSVLSNKYEEYYHRISYIPWIVLLLWMFCTTSFLLIFGLFFPCYTSLKWLTSGAIALAIFIIIDILIIFLKYRKTQYYWEDTSYLYYGKEAFIQKENLYEKYGKNLLKDSFKSKYTLPNPKQKKAAKEMEIAREEITDLIIDIIIYFIYLFLLYLIVLSSRDTMAYYSNEATRKIFVDASYSKTMPLYSIDSIDSFYEYLSETLIPTQNAKYWYPGWGTNEPGVVYDFNSKILGISRIRQVRILNGSCSVPVKMKFISDICNDEYSSKWNSKHNYFPKWSLEIKGHLSERMEMIWTYQGGGDSKSMFFIGQENTYPSGGYIAKLGRTYSNSLLILEYLKKYDWIDAQTRAIFIEFALYNANQNLFNVVTLALEKTASSLYIADYKIQTVKLLFLREEISEITFYSFIFFILIIGIHCFRQVKLFKKSSLRTYLSEIWTIIDIVIIIMAIVTLLLFINRDRVVNDLIEKLEEANHNEFVSFIWASYWDDVVNYMAAFLVCLSTIRLWKIIRFGKMFRLFENTISLALTSLIAVTFLQLLWFIAFGSAGLLLFGPFSKGFKTFWISLWNILITSIGFNRLVDYEEMSFGVVGSAYYFIYVFSIVVVSNIFIIVIIYYHVKSQKIVIRSDYSTKKFIKEELIYYVRKTKRRLKGGGQEDTYVVPASYDIRYAKQECVPNLNIDTMSFITSNILDEETYLKEKITEYVIGNSNDSEMVFFQDDATEDYVSDDRLLEIEKLINFLIEDTNGRKYIEYSKLLNSKTDGMLLIERFHELENSVNHIWLIVKNWEISIESENTFTCTEEISPNISFCYDENDDTSLVSFLEKRNLNFCFLNTCSNQNFENNDFIEDLGDERFLVRAQVHHPNDWEPVKTYCGFEPYAQNGIQIFSKFVKCKDKSDIENEDEIIVCCDS